MQVERDALSKPHLLCMRWVEGKGSKLPYTLAPTAAKLTAAGVNFAVQVDGEGEFATFFVSSRDTDRAEELLDE